MQHLQPNTTLQGGKYRIERVLGQGGFGNTYVGVNTVFNERVAIKEFFMKGVTQRDDNQTTVSVSNSENIDSFQQQKEKFKKEARRIRQLKNEHIVAVHDMFEENGTAYYVMDYVDGENLAERLKRTGHPMTEQEVLEILPQILDALNTVHNASIWHLDLKPANIMVDKKGNIKLIDFGASKQLNTQKGGATTSTAISYTNGYAPREQMEQNFDKFGPWSDFYALGATLYTMLTNKRPPLPTDIDDDINDDKHFALPIPQELQGSLEQKLILWLMETNRNLRPQNVDCITEFIKNDTFRSNDYLDKKGINELIENEDTILCQPIPNSLDDDNNNHPSSDVKKSESNNKYIGMKELVFFTFLLLVTMVIMVIAIVAMSK
ncbi:MAG: serine/threonine protein kinase [Prevotella sp.]|nr:serine/threonine protein kinase [Prevotella sp.]